MLTVPTTRFVVRLTPRGGEDRIGPVVEGVLTLRVKAGPSRGKYELATAPKSTTFTRIGEVDLYRPGLAFVTLPNPATAPPLSFTFDSAGIKHFRLKAIGSSGTGHLGYFDRINISRK